MDKFSSDEDDDRQKAINLMFELFQYFKSHFIQSQKSMQFDQVHVQSIWKDFTQLSSDEGAISDLEKYFKVFSKTIDFSSKLPRMRFQNIYYDLNYVPDNYDISSNLKEQFLNVPENPIVFIRSIFGLKESFLYVTYAKDQKKYIGQEIIKKENIQWLLSIFRVSATSAKFQLPIIIQIGDIAQSNFIGFKYNSPIETYYYSYSQINRPFSSLTEMKGEFEKSISSSNPNNFSNQTMSHRLSLQFTENSFVGLHNYHYQSIKFYTYMDRDPIQFFYTIFDFNSMENLHNDFINLSHSSSIVLSVRRIKSVFHESSIENYIHFMTQCQKRYYVSWKPVMTSSQNSFAQKSISDLFISCENDEVSDKKTILKAAPSHSLLIGLSILLAQSKDLNELAHLWIEFVKILREKTDKHEYLPGVGRTGPDFDNCLIYQKLEMINICIKHLNEENDQKGIELSEAQNELNNSESSQSSQKLMLDGSTMVLPTTKATLIRTEDQILDGIKLLEKNMDDQRQKAILQSDQLKSDMASFKTANPASQFEDFVFWYSPADFNAETKQLSQRMSTPDNVWRELWDATQPGNAQSKLFDPIAESEIALDYLESLAPGELIGDLIPVLLSAMYFDIHENMIKDISTIHSISESVAVIDDNLKHFHENVEKSQETISFEYYTKISLMVFKSIQEAMLDIHAARSLFEKLDHLIVPVSKLLETGVYLVVNEEEKQSVFKWLQAIGIDYQGQKEISENVIYNQQYILNGFVDEKTQNLQQRLFVGDYKDKFIVASTTQEMF